MYYNVDSATLEIYADKTGDTFEIRLRECVDAEEFAEFAHEFADVAEDDAEIFDALVEGMPEEFNNVYPGGELSSCEYYAAELSRFGFTFTVHNVDIEF